MPVAMMACVQASVFPIVLHGSSVTKRSAPRARSPAAFSATISACGPPYSRWNPSPTTSEFLSTSAATRGLGSTRPVPRFASLTARSEISWKFIIASPRSDQLAEEAQRRAVDEPDAHEPADQIASRREMDDEVL